MNGTRLAVAAAIVALAGLWGCGTGRSSPAAGGRSGTENGAGEITVFAASSLTEAFTDLGRILERERPGTEVTFNFASSSDLALQIAEGAPADVFAAADEEQMSVVDEAGRASAPARFATNRLVVLTPADNPAGLDGYEDLTRAGVKLVVAAPEVPAGAYARRAFAKLDIAEAAERNVVSNEQDVKAVVTKVALGEADAGVAYVTDVTDAVEGDVRVIELPENGEVTAVYPITVLEGAPNVTGARAFVDLVTSERGRQVLESFGFGPA
ncbi:molybdate ABC transporter substrate-binding protein [soil metagenome]